MKLLDNEVRFTSERYGNFCIIDGKNIYYYYQIDRGWVSPPSAKPDVSSLLGQRHESDYSTLWCVKMDGETKTDAISFNGFFKFSNHVEPTYRDDSYYIYTRINPLFAATEQCVVLSRLVRYIHWKLIGSPKIYWYTYMETDTKMFLCNQQADEFFDVFQNPAINYIKIIPNYDESGRSLGLAIFDPQDSYDKLVTNGYIDQTLNTSVHEYINSKIGGQ